jgi:hypothetical protein
VGGRGVETEVVTLDEIKDRPSRTFIFFAPLNDQSAAGHFSNGAGPESPLFRQRAGDARRGASVSIGVADGKPRIRINKARPRPRGRGSPIFSISPKCFIDACLCCGSPRFSNFRSARLF